MENSENHAERNHALRDKNIILNIKVLTLGVLSLAASVLNWLLISTALYGDKTLLFWIWPVLSMVFSVALFTLFSLINTNRRYAVILGIFSMIIYVAIFPKDIFVWLGGLLFLLLLFWFDQRIRSEERSRQNFSIRHVSAGSANVIVYGFIILLALNVYHNTSEDFKHNPESFYESLGKSAAKSARYISGNSDSGINLNQTIDEYLETETRRQNPSYDSLPEEFRNQYLEETKQQFFRQFNVDIPSNQPLSEFVAAFAVDRVRDSAERFSALFPLIFTIIIFALMRTFSFLFKWLSLFVTWLVYKLLLRYKFFRLSKVAIEIDKLEV